MKIKRASIAAATAAVVLLATGAEQGGCSTTGSVSGGSGDDGKDSSVDGEPCQFFLPGAPTVRVIKGGKQIQSHILSRCSKSPENHRVTVYIEKRNTYGNWDEVGSRDDDSAVGVGQTKTSKVTAPCASGVYRVKFDASVLMPKASAWDYGGKTDSRQTTIGKGECR